MTDEIVQGPGTLTQWGSDCRNCGNTTSGSMVCDQCGSDASTVELWALIFDRQDEPQTRPGDPAGGIVTSAAQASGVSVKASEAFEQAAEALTGARNCSDTGRVSAMVEVAYGWTRLGQALSGSDGTRADPTAPLAYGHERVEAVVYEVDDKAIVRLEGLGDLPTSWSVARRFSPGDTLKVSLQPGRPPAETGKEG